MKIISFIIYILTLILPKFNWLIIQTFPIWEDNGVSVYEYYKNNSRFKKIIWLIPDKLASIPFEINYSNTIFIKRNSIFGILYYMFSKYVCFTHGIYLRKFPYNQCVINLWHGMPLKRIGVEKGKGGLFANFTLSTSEYFVEYLVDAFKIPASSIINIGIPRNTRLLFPNINSRNKLMAGNSNKIVFWLPTYRKSIEGDVRLDGIDYGNAFNMPDFNISEFSALLSRLNFKIYVKPHPMALQIGFQDFGNLQIINDAWLYNNSLTLYEALSVADALISDISSVLVDFLLVNKPIIISFADKEKYLNDRDGCYKDFFDFLPGPFCSTQFELESAILALDNNQHLFDYNRLYLRKLFHKAQDNTLCSLDKILN